MVDYITTFYPAASGRGIKNIINIQLETISGIKDKRSFLLLKSNKAFKRPDMPLGFKLIKSDVLQILFFFDYIMPLYR